MHFIQSRQRGLAIGIAAYLLLLSPAHAACELVGSVLVSLDAGVSSSAVTGFGAKRHGAVMAIRRGVVEAAGEFKESGIEMVVLPRIEA